MVDRDFFKDAGEIASVNLVSTVLETEKENKTEISQKAVDLFKNSPAKDLFNTEDMTIITILIADTTQASEHFLFRLIDLLDLFTFRPKTRLTKDWKKAYDKAQVRFQQSFYIALKYRSAKSRDLILSVMIESLGKTQFLKDNVIVPDSLMQKMRKANGENEEQEEAF